MTKEEIINGLKMSMDLTLFDPSTGEVMEPWQLNDINRTAYEAYKGAIELLEKQPDTTTYDSNVVKTGKNDDYETSGDCISRRASLEKIRTMQTYKLFAGDDMILIDKAEAQTELMMLPSAQPERKTGRWIESNPQDSKVCRLMTCSECGKAYIVNINIPYEDWTEAHKFCVECGADMRGKTE